MKKLIVPVLVLAMAGCVSFHNPFARVNAKSADAAPEPLKQVALDIEKAIQAGEREPKLEDRDGIVITTDTIKQAVKMRAARSEMVNQLLDTGFAQENRNGLITILRSNAYKKATTYRQRDRDALLVLNENNDRWALYEGIDKASKTPLATATVQAAFHEARVKCLKPGQKYQENPEASGKADGK